MNERIQELAVQAFSFASVADDSNESDDPDANWWEKYNEKFAELIVRECLGIVSDVGSRKWMGFKGTDTDHCLFRIRQHFGVK